MGRPHNQAIEAVREFVDMLPGGHCYVLSQSGRLHGSAGIPDLYCMVKDTAFWVEVKVGRDKLSPAQAEFKARSGMAGVPVIVGHAKDVIDFLEMDRTFAEGGVRC